MKLLRLTPVALLIVFGDLTAVADNWGGWERFGNTGISVRFAQVNRTMCTWSFRNDSSRILTTLNFAIDDINAETGQTEHSTDLLPYSLRPGQSVGGWTAFSAAANCGTVRLTSTDIEWK
jgi:hypothetical protein